MSNVKLEEIVSFERGVADHAVVRIGDASVTVECLVCRATLRMFLPIKASSFTSQSLSFVERHRRCEK